MNTKRILTTLCIASEYPMFKIDSEGWLVYTVTMALILALWWFIPLKGK